MSERAPSSNKRFDLDSRKRVEPPQQSSSRFSNLVDHEPAPRRNDSDRPASRPQRSSSPLKVNSRAAVLAEAAAEPRSYPPRERNFDRPAASAPPATSDRFRTLANDEAEYQQRRAEYRSRREEGASGDFRSRRDEAPPTASARFSGLASEASYERPERAERGERYSSGPRQMNAMNSRWQRDEEGDSRDSYSRSARGGSSGGGYIERRMQMSARRNGDLGDLPSAPRSKRADVLPSGPASKRGLASAPVLPLRAEEEKPKGRQVEVVDDLPAKAETVTALDIAIDENKVITAKELAESVKKFDFENVDEPTLASVMVRSVSAGKLTVFDVASQLRIALSEPYPEFLADVLFLVLTKLRDLWPIAKLVESVETSRKSGCDVLDLIRSLAAGDASSSLSSASSAVSDEAFAAWLNQHQLVALLPVSNDVVDKFRAAIKQGVDAIQPLLASTAAHVSLISLLADAAEAAFSAAVAAPESLAPWCSLLKRVAGTDRDLQRQFVVILMQKWDQAGKKKGQFKEICIILHSQSVVSYHGFIAWKEFKPTDAKLTTIKRMALVEVSSWFTEIEPKQTEEEYDEADDEELEEAFA